MNKVLNKFLDLMKLSDDDYDDDFLDDNDDFDDFEDEQPQKSTSKKKSTKYEEPSFDDEEPSYKSTYSSSTSNSKITQMRQPSSTAPSRQTANMGVCIIKPTSIEDGREICETLLEKRTVILNLEGLDLEIAQRIIDFTSGSTYAMKGNLQKISNYIFLVTPENVNISGDLQDWLNNSYDVSSVRSRY